LWYPFAILWWSQGWRAAKGLPNLNLLCRALMITTSSILPAALAIQLPGRGLSIWRDSSLAQPAFALDILLFLFAGGLLGGNIG